VNDGQKGVRGYRNTLFNAVDLKLIGIAGNQHKAEDSVLLLVFAKGILSSG
jgi:hypothetical protein